MVCGDLNEILDRGGKWGEKNRIKQHMEEFRETIDSCALKDLGFRGPKFTWCNNRDKEGCIYERLNQILATKPWCLL